MSPSGPLAVSFIDLTRKSSLLAMYNKSFIDQANVCSRWLDVGLVIFWIFIDLSLSLIFSEGREASVHRLKFLLVCKNAKMNLANKQPC